MEKHKHYWLYVLKLEQGKYYVGITAKTPEARFLEHKNGFMGAQWTKKYKPISLFDRKDLGIMSLSEAERYENKVVRTYMNKKGYNNVRGGNLSSKDDYVKRFGWYYDREQWKGILGVIIGTAILIITILVLMYNALR